MTEWVSDFLNTAPFAAVYLFLVCVVSLRSTATYGIGRYAHHLIMTSQQPSSGFPRRVWNWAHAESTLTAQAQVRARGWIAIPLAFLTVGVQSVVVLAAGVIGLSLPRFAAAALPGWLAWAAIYSTIGFAVWRAVIGAAAGSPIGIAIIAAAVGAIAWLVYSRRRQPEKLPGEGNES